MFFREYSVLYHSRSFIVENKYLNKPINYTLQIYNCMKKVMIYRVSFDAGINLELSHDRTSVKQSTYIKMTRISRTVFNCRS